MGTRNYRKTKRAEQQEQTRESIVEATVALHQEVGPANTSIKAIAEKAGVQRLTVYRYFPDENSLFLACTGHWFKQNPPPSLLQWEHLCLAKERTYAAVLAFYNYYRQTESMWTRVYRDVEQIDAMQEPMSRFENYLDQVRDDLLTCWKLRGKRKQQLALTLRHSLRFSTWLSLKKENLKDEQIAHLIMFWIEK